jgi:hypothetical protein
MLKVQGKCEKDRLIVGVYALSPMDKKNEKMLGGRRER